MIDWMERRMVVKGSRQRARGQRSERKCRVRISNGHIAEIREMILETRAPINWEWIVDEATRVCGHKWTRQGLNKHETIKAAYREKKDAEKKSRCIPQGDLAAFHLSEKVERQKIEIRRLENLVKSYEEMFILYQANAHSRGISPAELEMPLEPINRRSTD